MPDNDPDIQAILAEQQQALNDIDKQFHQPTLLERIKTLFTGLSADKASREYKLACTEAQRLAAPALAILLPCVLMGSIALLATGTTKTVVTYKVEVIEAEETKELEKEIPPEQQVREDFETYDTDRKSTRLNSSH